LRLGMIKNPYELGTYKFRVSGRDGLRKLRYRHPAYCHSLFPLLALSCDLQMPTGIAVSGWRDTLSTSPYDLWMPLVFRLPKVMTRFKTPMPECLEAKHDASQDDPPPQGGTHYVLDNPGYIKPLKRRPCCRQ